MDLLRKRPHPGCSGDGGCARRQILLLMSRGAIRQLLTPLATENRAINTNGGKRKKTPRNKRP